MAVGYRLSFLVLASASSIGVILLDLNSIYNFIKDVHSIKLNVASLLARCHFIIHFTSIRSAHTHIEILQYRIAFYIFIEWHRRYTRPMCVVFQYFFFIHFIVAGDDVDGETLPWYGWHRHSKSVYIDWSGSGCRWYKIHWINDWYLLFIFVRFHIRFDSFDMFLHGWLSIISLFFAASDFSSSSFSSRRL